MAVVWLGAAAAAAVAQRPPLDVNRKPKVVGFANERVEEKLDRGLVALPAGGGHIYVGWRLLKEDSPDTAFHVYRSTPGQAAVFYRGEDVVGGGTVAGASFAASPNG